MKPKRSIIILFLGDVIGKPGRAVIKRYLSEGPPKADLVVANVENAAHGFGMTQSNLVELRQAGVNVFTGGNHTFDKKETVEFIDAEVDVLRPANYPEGTPGTGLRVVECADVKVGIINLMGRVFMEPLDSPFAVADKLLPEVKAETNIVLVDMHAEATAEKIALGYYLDGRVSAVVGTHTHVQTADERLLPKGTAFITDIGCCGPTQGVIGMDRELVLRRMVNQLPTRLEVAKGPAMLNGVFVEVAVATGQALSIKRVQFFEDADTCEAGR